MKGKIAMLEMNLKASINNLNYIRYMEYKEKENGGNKGNLESDKTTSAEQYK